MSFAAGFYEDDEPQEKIEAAFDRGEKRLTGPPSPSTTAVAFSRNERFGFDRSTTPSETVAAHVTRT